MTETQTETNLVPIRFRPTDLERPSEHGEHLTLGRWKSGRADARTGLNLTGQELVERTARQFWELQRATRDEADEPQKRSHSDRATVKIERQVQSDLIDALQKPAVLLPLRRRLLLFIIACVIAAVIPFPALVGVVALAVLGTVLHLRWNLRERRRVAALCAEVIREVREVHAERYAASEDPRRWPFGGTNQSGPRGPLSPEVSQ